MVKVTTKKKNQGKNSTEYKCLDAFKSRADFKERWKDVE